MGLDMEIALVQGNGAWKGIMGCASCLYNAWQFRGMKEEAIYGQKSASTT